MKTSAKIGWGIAILASIIIFSLAASSSNDWVRNKVLVHEAVYEYVPASQTQIIVCWLGVTAFSMLIGSVVGLLVYGTMEEKKQ